MIIGKYNGTWARTRRVHSFNQSAYTELSDLMDETVGHISWEIYEPVRLWLDTHWSTNTYSGENFERVPYDKIPEELIKKWKKLDNGDVVYSGTIPFHYTTAVRVQPTQEKVLKILQSYHVDVFSIYDVAILVNTDEGYEWKTLSLPVRYSEITTRKPDINDDQLMKLMEANLRL